MRQYSSFHENVVYGTPNKYTNRKYKERCNKHN